MNTFYTLAMKTTALAYTKMNNGTVKKLWKSFCLTEGELTVIPCEEFVFRIGDTPIPDLPTGKEYALCVDSRGVSVVGWDYGGLMRGFFALLMKIEQQDGAFVLAHTQQQSDYILQNRMIHICVFPENDLYFIKKLIRLSALCQYTHIVIEFWGMLAYNCLQELSWPHAFTKAEAKDLIRECREMGIEPIPMFNQLGHATACRLCYGKHVVLDQNPTLQYLFTPDGWAWDIRSAQVKKLLRNVRGELYDLFGEGTYMHAGCDEAYFISQNPSYRKDLPAYLRDLTGEIESEGRRTMLWMDMLLEKDAFKDCYSVGEADEVEALRKATAKSTVFVDWQYACRDVPVPSLLSLKDCGRDVIGAPWTVPENYRAHTETVRQHGMHGVMLTTWHTLRQYMYEILGFAKQFGASTFFWSAFSGLNEETATLLRRVSFEGNSYSDSGWSKAQIEF